MDHYAKDSDSPSYISEKLKIEKISTDDLSYTEDDDYDNAENNNNDDDNDENFLDMVDIDEDNYTFNDQDIYKNDKSTPLADYDLLQAQFDEADLPTGVEVSVPVLIKSQASKNRHYNNNKPKKKKKKKKRKEEKIDNLLDIIKFKSFDVVESFNEHHFMSEGSCKKKFPKEWSNRIQMEWKSLATDLPETIFVRVAEDRIDLLRAALVGPAGTPYHDGLFFFDCHFPPDYPNKPPLVHFRSGGLRLNPNLFESGRVCLSLLGTWKGEDSENWVAGKSTMLQVLVSIQGLVLNEKPFFNEPSHVTRYGPDADNKSNMYNARTFLFSLKTMAYTLRRPPEHFKNLVVSHFRSRERDILTACKAYTEGALVGSDLKNFEKHENKSSKTCSLAFTKNVNLLMDMLVEHFSRFRAPNCD